MNGYMQLDWHFGDVPWPEWGSQPRGPLIVCDIAHQGEWLGQLNRTQLALRCEICVAIHAWPLDPVPTTVSLPKTGVVVWASMMFRSHHWPTELLLAVAEVSPPGTQMPLIVCNALVRPWRTILQVPDWAWWAWTPKTLELACRWTSWDTQMTCEGDLIKAVLTRRA